MMKRENSYVLRKRENSNGFTPLDILRKSRGGKAGNQKSLTGFTLIELLVVIAIIGVLATITMVSINGLRARARDDRRAADMKAIRDALAMYQVQYATYPSFTEETTLTGSDAFSSEIVSDRLMQSVPVDPTNVSPYVYTYQSLSGDSTYVLKFCMETDHLKSYTPGCGNTIGP